MKPNWPIKVERFLASLVSREVETKAPLKWHFSPISAKIRFMAFCAEEDMGKQGTPILLLGL